jgi:hypothetical protein
LATVGMAHDNNLPSDVLNSTLYYIDVIVG